MAEKKLNHLQEALADQMAGLLAQGGYDLGTVALGTVLGAVAVAAPGVVVPAGIAAFCAATGLKAWLGTRKAKDRRTFAKTVDRLAASAKRGKAVIDELNAEITVDHFDQSMDHDRILHATAVLITLARQ